MYINLFFLILVLLMITSPSGNATRLKTMPGEAFLMGIALYFVFLAVIWLQNRFLKGILRFRKEGILILANIELLIYFAIYHFVLGVPRFLMGFLWVGKLQTPIVLFSLTLYFIGLIVFHASFHRYNRSLQVMREIRFLIPFTLPFLLVTILGDTLIFYPNQEALSHFADTTTGILTITGVTLIFVLLIMLFLPYMIQMIWQCKPLPASPLKDRLEAFCHHAQFKHAGLKTWTVLNHALTAAIIGLIPSFRYVMFTKRLLDEAPPESVEAILAHEIGHSYWRHLWIYPFIIFGIPVGLGLFSLFSLPAINRFFTDISQIYPSNAWNWIYPLTLFIIYATCISLYLRFVFGFFSRLFERQADLHVFALGVHPKHLIEALRYVGTATGQSLNHPNWHHYSIQQRIDFLNAAEKHPQLVHIHHRHMRRCVFGYGMLLLLTLAFLICYPLNF